MCAHALEELLISFVSHKDSDPLFSCCDLLLVVEPPGQRPEQLAPYTTHASGENFRPDETGETGLQKNSSRRCLSFARSNLRVAIDPCRDAPQLLWGSGTRCRRSGRRDSQSRFEH